jgi:2-oxoglutarate ferredoxin oxidoreductase subunit alpha
MIKAGDGYRVHVTGLTHDEKGYPNMTVGTQARLVHRLVDKLKVNAKSILEYREDGVEGADIVVVTYGITSRTALPAVDQARREGMKVGHLRLVVAWPFPEERIRALSSQVKAFVVPELNFGQMALEVERCAAGKANVVCVPHAGGTVHDPKEIYAGIRASVKGGR